jgi:fluoride exporter
VSTPPHDAADVAAPLRLALPVVFLGGMAGTAVRVGVTELLPTGAYAWGLLAVNVLGALLLGLLFERLQEQRLARGRRWALWGPGFLGALTTFSAFQLEVVDAMRDGDWKYGVLYLLATLGLGLPAAALGRRLGRITA